MKQRLAWCASLLLSLTLAGCHGSSDKPARQPDASAKKGSDSGGGSGSSSGDGAQSNGGAGKEQNTSVPSDITKIAPQDQARAGIRIAPVMVRSLPRTLTVAGQVAMDERHTDHIGSIADGRVERVFVLPGDPVRRGQTLATLHSHSVHETVAALMQAFAAVDRQHSAVNFSTQARDRYTRLYTIQAASLEEKQRSDQDLAQANKDLIDAQANVKAEREHLGELLGVRPESLVPGDLYQRELIPIRAVSDGVVIQRSATPGQVMNTGDEMFVTSNLATVWVNAAVNEKDVPQVHAGAAASVSLQGDASGQKGQVARLGDMVDPQTRTLPVRLAVPNPGTRLRPGMFVTAAIAEPATRTAIFVPAGALQDVNGFRVVFVTPDGSSFQARAVKTGAETRGMVEITDGLMPTNHVVVDGAFMVKGQLLKGSVGEG